MAESVAEQIETTAKQGSTILQATGIEKTYRIGGRDLQVLRGVDAQVQNGEWLAVLGRSGSGKSTLLHILGGLDRPDAGQVTFRDQTLFDLYGNVLDGYRNKHVGFVFQQYHLLPELTAMENVLVAAMIQPGPLGWLKQRREVKDRAAALLDRVGLSDRLTHKPNKLSGGERQRVAIARALINQPAVLLADEPTGNLDIDTAGGIIDLFQSLHQDGQTIVMVTHDQAVADVADRQVTLKAGQLATTNKV